ncbi:hypothetical protein BS47DRAFT_1149547 [Hydnum rufescens UP504]|uniref:Uncharacterized protein n=1 Tax=Hydnum rufescens UP504 TaxID=1448309 RepID=A0A9P6B8H4_9AGAM|nr:hypothetical protein BS47DRAFT_1149547 [Hydnum rufescens UP504]
MTMAGTLLCTIGTSLCSACVLVSMVFFIYNNPLWRSRMQRELLVDSQLISIRLHVPLILVTTADLIGYFFFPRIYVSMTMAMIVGKVWSNALIHGLNSRRGLRATFHAPQTTDLKAMIRRRRGNSSVRDPKLSMERVGDGGTCPLVLLRTG